MWCRGKELTGSDEGDIVQQMGKETTLIYSTHSHTDWLFDPNKISMQIGGVPSPQFKREIRESVWVSLPVRAQAFWSVQNSECRTSSIAWSLYIFDALPGTTWGSMTTPTRSLVLAAHHPPLESEPCLILAWKVPLACLILKVSSPRLPPVSCQKAGTAKVLSSEFPEPAAQWRGCMRCAWLNRESCASRLLWCFTMCIAFYNYNKLRSATCSSYIFKPQAFIVSGLLATGGGGAGVNADKFPCSRYTVPQVLCIVAR
jgi:hypothetical protein